MTRAAAVRRGVLAVLVGLLLAGCQPAAEPGKPRLSAQQEKVRTAYLAYWGALLRANEVGDAELPELARTAAGEQLTVARRGIEQSKRQGTVARGTVAHDVREVRMDGTLAYVLDCVDLRKWIQYAVDTGAMRENQFLDRPPTLGRFTLATRDGSWLVTQTREMGSC